MPSELRHVDDSEIGTQEFFYEDPDFEGEAKDYEQFKVKHGLDKWFRVMWTHDAAYYLRLYNKTRDPETG